MSADMGLPVETLISKFYTKAAKAAAKIEVDKGLKESDDEEEAPPTEEPEETGPEERSARSGFAQSKA